MSSPIRQKICGFGNSLGNEVMTHPKSFMVGVVALAAIVTLGVFIAQGAPLSGAVNRALIAGVTTATIGLSAAAIIGWKRGTQQNKTAEKTH